MFRILSMILLLWATALSAQDRFALVIGNGAYESITPLNSAGRDAELVAAALEAADFDVDLVVDANLVALKRSIGAFSQRVRSTGPESMGFLYFAGHGVNAFGENFLLPVDVEIETVDDLDFVSVNVSTLLYAFDPKFRAQNMVFLDCCVENPYADIDGVSQGLLEMNAPEGNVIAFSSPAETVRVDADGATIFAAGLAIVMSVPGLSVDEIFSRLVETGQTPYFDSALTEPFVFIAEPELTPEELAWNEIQDSSDSTVILTFLSEFPGGQFEAAAKQKLIDIFQAELASSAPAATEPAEEPAVEELPADEATEVVPPVEIPLPAFDQPLAYGDEPILGKTLAEVIELTPSFTPIEDLPPVLWENQQCATCHEWNQEALCEQAKFYLTDAGEVAMTKPHPFGGTLKQNLRRWAEGGCP